MRSWRHRWRGPRKRRWERGWVRASAGRLSRGRRAPRPNPRLCVESVTVTGKLHSTTTPAPGRSPVVLRMLFMHMHSSTGLGIRARSRRAMQLLDGCDGARSLPFPAPFSGRPPIGAAESRRPRNPIRSRRHRSRSGARSRRRSPRRSRVTRRRRRPRRRWRRCRARRQGSTGGESACDGSPAASDLSMSALFSRMWRWRSVKKNPITVNAPAYTPAARCWPRLSFRYAAISDVANGRIAILISSNRLSPRIA